MESVEEEVFNRFKTTNFTKSDNNIVGFGHKAPFKAFSRTGVLNKDSTTYKDYNDYAASFLKTEIYGGVNVDSSGKVRYEPPTDGTKVTYIHHVNTQMYFDTKPFHEDMMSTPVKVTEATHPTEVGPSMEIEVPDIDWGDNNLEFKPSVVVHDGKFTPKDAIPLTPEYLREAQEAAELITGKKVPDEKLENVVNSTGNIISPYKNPLIEC